ncbi:hypothetical protein [Cyclobacterium salsum]|uniref:hypothetical protein n=1 Tax=Cyclobacterium salsum TaxID=2666329 RepID=UPI0013918409|nr:hypothetical protein [Cyclobacterium salsum]
MIKCFLLFFFLFFRVEFTNGQSVPEIGFINQYEQVIQWYPEINTGSHYIEKRRSLDGHPYYSSSTMENGTLSIAGFIFENIPIQYEIWDDLILSFSSTFKQKMILNHSKIDYIVLNDGTVIIKKSQPEGFIFHQNGFYREIVNGHIGLYCKHRKQRKQETSTLGLVRSYEEVQKYFFEMNGALIAVPAKRRIFSLLEIDKRTTKRRLRKDGLRFRKNREAYLKTLVNLANEQGKNE